MPADAHRNCRLPGNTTCAMFQLRQNRQQTLLSFNRGTTGDPIVAAWMLFALQKWNNKMTTRRRIDEITIYSTYSNILLHMQKRLFAITRVSSHLRDQST